MTRRAMLRFALVLALLAGILVVGFCVLTRGPQYKGKPISYWVDHGCSQAAGSAVFRDEIKQIGPPAVPFLIKKLQTRDANLRRLVVNTRKKLPRYLKGLLPDYEDAANIRAAAADCLAMVGPDAKQAVPSLIGLLNDDTVVAPHAANALGQIGPAAKAAVPTLKGFLTNPAFISQQDSARALWKIDRDTNSLLQVFTWSQIPGPEPRFLINSLALLDTLGAAAAPAVPDLIRILGDPSRHSSARGNAAMVLGEIGLRDKQITEALLAGMTDPNSQIKWRCALALWKLDDQYANLAVPQVVDYIASENKNSRNNGYTNFHRSFVTVAGRNNPNVRTAIPALKELLSNEDPEVKRVVAEALRDLAPPPAVERGDK